MIFGIACQFLSTSPKRQTFWEFDRDCVDPIGQLERSAFLTIVSLLVYELCVIYFVDGHLVLAFSFFIIMNSVTVNTLGHVCWPFSDDGPYLRVELLVAGCVQYCYFPK